MDVFEAIRTRRSIRRFQPRPVGEELLGQVLEAARMAPSWANTQCVRYTVVEDPALKETIVTTFSATNPARVGSMEAPLLLVVSAKTGTSGHKKGTPITDKGDGWAMFDAALAIQNLTLAAHALGLGTVQVGYFDAPRVAALVDLPDDEVAVEVIPLGWPDQAPLPTSRRPLEELVRRR
jgi:nitroreductase